MDLSNKRLDSWGVHLVLILEPDSRAAAPGLYAEGDASIMFAPIAHRSTQASALIA